MAFVFEGLVGATLTLTILYFLLFVYTGKRLIWLQSNSSSGLNTRKLFVMTCMLTSALRVMSFGSMAMLDLGRVDFEVESDDASGTGDFFEKSSLVLFNFPDFCCISAYVLLLVIWAETYLKSRRHWYSTMRFRKAWMLGYFIFNIILYASQLTIYSLLLLPSVDKYYETTLMYLTLSAFNLVLPVMWIALYLYLAIVFSGFPFSTAMDKFRLRILSQLGLVWTFARLGWGLIALTTVLRGWLVEASRSRLFYSVVLVMIFILVEAVPILFSLQEKVLQSLSERDLSFLINGSGAQAAESNGQLVVASRLEADFQRLSDHSGQTIHKISPSGYILDTEVYQDDEDTSLLQDRLLATSSTASMAPSATSTPRSTSYLHQQQHYPTAPGTPVITAANGYRATTSTPSTANSRVANNSGFASGAASWLFGGETRSAPPTIQRQGRTGNNHADPTSPTWDHFRTSFSATTPAHQPYNVQTSTSAANDNQVVSYQQEQTIPLINTPSSAPIPIPPSASNAATNTVPPATTGSDAIGSYESTRASYYTASPGFSPPQSNTGTTLDADANDVPATNFWRSLIGF